MNTIILYSKYSNSSTTLIKMLNSYPVDLESYFNLNLVCIDNENIRNQVLNSKNIQIKSVPTLLVISDNEEVNLYEHDTILKWFNEQISKNPKLKPPTPPTPPEPSYSPPKQQDIVDDKAPHEELGNKNKPTFKTNIDEIDLNEKIDESNINRPPVPMINNEGGYDLTTDFGEPDSPNRNVSKHIKPSTQISTNSPGLMSQALAMQKERESTEPKNPITPSNTS
jgi:hypothetical protein